MKRLLSALLALVGLGGLVAAAKAPPASPDTASQSQGARQADLIVCPITGELIPSCCCPAGRE